MTTPPFVFRGIRSYIQGPGVIRTVGTYLSQSCGTDRTCIVIDRSVLSLLETIEKSLTEARIDFRISEFDGDLRAQNVERLAERIRVDDSPRAILGVGGGKTIDVAKIVASRLGTPYAILATSSSTDAAPSHSAVLLDSDSQISAESLDRNPDLVIVDSEVILSAPVRLFVAGIGDAVSKKYEMDTAARLGERNAFGGRAVFFVSPLARTLHEALLSQGVEAKRCIQEGILSDAVETVITACVLLSTLVWENGGLAGAHSIANVLFNAGYGKENLHGELVALSLLVLLILEDRQEESRRLTAYYRQIGLPCRASELGIPFEDRTMMSAICDAVHHRYEKHELHYSSGTILQAIEQLQQAHP
jgi:glycerol dehydrogenase